MTYKGYALWMSVNDQGIADSNGEERAFLVLNDSNDLLEFTSDFDRAPSVLKGVFNWPLRYKTEGASCCLPEVSSIR